MSVRIPRIRATRSSSALSTATPPGFMPADHLGLRFGNRVDGREELKVNRRDDGDKAQVGRRDPRKLADLSLVIHPHLEDREIEIRSPRAVGLHLEHGQRQPVSVIEIAGRLCDAPAARERRRSHLFCGRLSHAPGYRRRRGPASCRAPRRQAAATPRAYRRQQSAARRSVEFAAEANSSRNHCGNRAFL